MAQDRDSEVDIIVQKVVSRIAAALSTSAGPGYHCTGSIFECGTYDCIAAVHSCTNAYKCTGKFTEFALRE